MLTLLTVMLIALAPRVLYAQYAFPLGELQKLTTKNASDFETEVMKKDYSYQQKQSNKELKVYTSDKPGKEGQKYVISRYQVPNAMAKVTFITTDKNYYLDVKAKLAATGVKYVNNEEKMVDGNAATVYNYANGALRVALITYSTDINWYRVEVHF